MSKEEEKLRFVAFCIEQYKHRRGGDGESVYDLFASSGALRFLMDFFDVEHCLDADQVLDDIEKIIARSRREVHV